jgi:hypothetical protein
MKNKAEIDAELDRLERLITDLIGERSRRTESGSRPTEQTEGTAIEEGA